MCKEAAKTGLPELQVLSMEGALAAAAPITPPPPIRPLPPITPPWAKRFPARASQQAMVRSLFICNLPRRNLLVAEIIYGQDVGYG